MATVTVFRGLPGSGKTTAAKKLQADNPSSVRISRDDMREHLFGREGILGQDDENWITKRLNELAIQSLKSGFDVIVDSTNLRRKYVADWHKLAFKHGAEFKVVDLRYVHSPQDCASQDFRRGLAGGREVGSAVILDLAKKYLNKSNDYNVTEAEGTLRHDATITNPQYVRDDSLPKAFIVDIDGTLALHEPHRSPYDTSLYHLDRVNEPVARVVRALKSDGYAIIYTSGRHVDFYDATMLWLRTNDMPIDWLIMREDAGARDDVEKLRLFRTYIEGYWAVHGAIDDRDRCVDLWRSLGLVCLQVAPGNF